MKWQKYGVIYQNNSPTQHPKLLTHAANPLPIHIEGDMYRIFFSARDVKNRSSIGGVDINIITRQIIREYKQPFFEHGPVGSFYADGVSIGNCYEVNGIKYILFMGWQNPKEGHWRGDIGRLIVAPDLTLKLDSTAPFMSTSHVDAISLSYPWVLYDSGCYHMWYGSTSTWDAGNGEMIHTINYATSVDGANWDRHGLAVPYEIGVAQAFSKPSIIKDKNGFHMWFSYRSGSGQTYRIGYAYSHTIESNWELQLHQKKIDVSLEGWDSEMIEYPFVFQHKEKYFMLYNGNGYGKSGFGLAILE